MASLVSPFTIEPLQSATGFISPGFIVTSAGNITAAGNITSAGNIIADGDIVLTTGSITNGTTTLLTNAGLGSSLTSSNLTSVGTLTSLTVSGPTVLTGNISINTGSGSGTIDKVDIGTTTAGIGNFTDLDVQGDIVLTPIGTNSIVIDPNTAGTIDNVTIGNSSPLAGYFTNLQATGLTSTTVTATTGSFSTSISSAAATLTNVTVAGTVTQSTAPTLNSHLANKLYVDRAKNAAIAIGIGLS